MTTGSRLWQRWIATNNRVVPRVMKTKLPNTVMVFGVVLSEGYIMPPHILKVHTKMNLDVLKSVVIPWSNQVAGGRPWLWHQESTAHKSKETQAWPQKDCNDFVPFSHWTPVLPQPEPAGLLHWLIRREHYQHDLPQHQSQPDSRHPPSIRQAPAGACGKGMLPVPDPYWLRLKAAILNRCQLYYIIKLAELIFSIKVLK